MKNNKTTFLDLSCLVIKKNVIWMLLVYEDNMNMKHFHEETFTFVTFSEKLLSSVITTHCQSHPKLSHTFLTLACSSLFTFVFVSLARIATPFHFTLKGQITTSCDSVFLLLDKYQHAPRARDVHFCWLCLSSYVVIFLKLLLLLFHLCILFDVKQKSCARKIKICVFLNILSQI